MLKKLKQNKLSHKTESEYQVWQEGSHPEEITTDEMMHQKLKYIHNNPVRCGYIEEPGQWRYFPHPSLHLISGIPYSGTSAQNYEDKEGLVNVDMEW